MSDSRQPPAAKPVGASFRDPSGFVFSRDGLFFRQVNLSYREQYNQFIDSGLYDALVKGKLLLPHEVVDTPPAQSDISFQVLFPEQLRFVSYPYEWSFSQFKDAALATLNIQKIALEHGMSLKDSSAYNIQFRHGLPTLIDSLSFEPYQEGKPWVAYRQFCQHFLAPLSLASLRDIHFLSMLKVDLDGIPLDFASRVLPSRTRIQPALLLHIHAHAASQKRYASAGSSPKDTSRQVSRNAMLGLIDSLESAVRKLEWEKTSTAWASYYEADHNYTPNALDHKTRLVSEYLQIIKPRIVWDLGANTGVFSRLASNSGAFTLAFDYDPGAVELNYREVREKGEADLLPLVQDLTNPSPGIGWQNRERSGLIERANADAVMALALIHHLAIGNNLPLDHLASFFQSLGRWLIVEFVPKEDSQVQRLLATREDIFPHYTAESFEAAFQNKFAIRRSDLITESVRRLYLLEKL
jgi:hypothetical protein